MKIQRGSSKLGGVLIGRRARRIYFGLILAVIFISISIRVSTFLLTRKIYAVLSGLEQMRADVTTEDQALKLIPNLTQVATKHVESGEWRQYRVEVTNHYTEFRWMRWVPSFLWNISPGSSQLRRLRWIDKWKYLRLVLGVPYSMGWRNVSFTAYVTVLNKTVSSTEYFLEPDVPVSIPVSYLVTVRSAHSVWARGSIPISSADDESPDYRFGPSAGEFSMLPEPDSKIGVAFTSDAPRDLISHAFQVDLSCFWSVRGCDSVRQVTPLLWKDQQAIAESTMARLTSINPCPDRILAGRVRTLTDLNVALLEVVNSRWEEMNREGDRRQELVTDYRLIETIRGQPKGPWLNIRFREGIPSPLSPSSMIANPLGRTWPKPGDRFLYFSGATFDSCRIVPATPSAEAAVRKSAAPAKRQEDDISGFSRRM